MTDRPAEEIPRWLDDALDLSRLELGPNAMDSPWVEVGIDSLGILMVWAAAECEVGRELSASLTEATSTLRDLATWVAAMSDSAA